MKHFFHLLLFTFSCTVSLNAIPAERLQSTITTTKNPFNYDLHITIVPGHSQDEDVFICLHGMGSDYTLANVLRANPAIPYHIVSFNFPDHGGQFSRKNLPSITFGTIDEILPALYVWKCCVIDGRANKIHLYGFSAGGGALINALAVLNSHRYDVQLKEIGIGIEEKQRMLESIQNGSAILEVPLKSFDEIANERVQELAVRAKNNGMRPIDNLSQLQGLSIPFFVYFANPDEVLSNRDDLEYVQRLTQANQGPTVAVSGKGGHLGYHKELWEAYKVFLNGQANAKFH